MSSGAGHINYAEHTGYPTMTLPRMLKVKEAAEIFRVGTTTIRTAVQTGKLPGYHPNKHTILLRADEVDAWIRTCRYKTNSRD